MKCLKCLFPSKELENVNVKYKMESLKSLISIIKAGILKSMDKEEAKLKKTIKELKKEIEEAKDYETFLVNSESIKQKEDVYKYIYVSCLDDDSFECSQRENLAAYSIIPLCYMLFETSLVEFAKIAKKNYELNLSYNNLNGGKIERIKRYLQLVGIDISEIKTWKDLKNLEVIRNCIIHNEGKVNESFKMTNFNEIIKIYKNNFSINKPSLENEDYIIIKLQLCLEFIEKLELFFDVLIDKFGLNIDFYFGEEVDNKVLNLKDSAKLEYRNTIKMAKKVYLKKIKRLGR